VTGCPPAAQTPSLSVAVLHVALIPIARERYKSIRRIARGTFHNAGSFCAQGGVPAGGGLLGTWEMCVSQHGGQFTAFLAGFLGRALALLLAGESVLWRLPQSLCSYGGSAAGSGFLSCSRKQESISAATFPDLAGRDG
jgi:hypothetical protein